jgi:hypothetical protein
MSHQKSIIYMTIPPECWTNLKKFCNAKDLKYNTIARKVDQLEKEGLEHEGIKYYRVKNR